MLLDIAKVLCGRSGEEWESLRFLKEVLLANESLHSRRFLGRGVAQSSCSVESCIPDDPPCVREVAREPGGKDRVDYVFSRFIAHYRILYDRRWRTANTVYMFQ